MVDKRRLKNRKFVLCSAVATCTRYLNSILRLQQGGSHGSSLT